MDFFRMWDSEVFPRALSTLDISLRLWPRERKLFFQTLCPARRTKTEAGSLTFRSRAHDACQFSYSQAIRLSLLSIVRFRVSAL
jgi:hypothetical protein